MRSIIPFFNMVSDVEGKSVPGMSSRVVFIRLDD